MNEVSWNQVLTKDVAMVINTQETFLRRFLILGFILIRSVSWYFRNHRNRIVKKVRN